MTGVQTCALPICTRGAKGTDGIQGNQGTQGLRGSQGTQGAIGTRGLSGSSYSLTLKNTSGGTTTYNGTAAVDMSTSLRAKQAETINVTDQNSNVNKQFLVTTGTDSDGIGYVTPGRDSSLYYNSDTLATPKVRIDEKVTLQYNSTEKTIEFVFN